MNILGINHNFHHDSSAVLLCEKTLTFASLEERYTRRCHDGAFPSTAIQTALDHASIDPGQLDFAVFAWSHPYASLFHSLRDSFDLRSPIDTAHFFIRGNLRRLFTRGGAKTLKREFGDIPVRFCDHHMAHALSAYAYSDLDPATIVVIDGRGSFEATSIWHAQKGRIQLVDLLRWPNSLGLFYAMFTTYLGFKPLSDEWKVMGLAAYGKPGINLDAFLSLSTSPYRIATEALYRRSLLDVSGIEAVFGPRRNPDGEITQRHKDIAYAVQEYTERAMLRVVEHGIAKTKTPQVCLAGGVAMNCKANGLLASHPSVDALFVQPAASDDGTALGAAVFPYLETEGRIPKIAFPSLYLGESFTDEEIEAQLRTIKIPFERMTNRSERLAGLLAEGKVIGHFTGRMEFAARGLGHRSILADPRQLETKAKVNNLVKYREDWRPFAPSILEEYYHEYFAADGLAPYMILSFPVREEKAASIAATTHVDASARPQTVSRVVSPVYWELIEAFRQKTSVPVLLNTSFNLKGEPIVRTPIDAIRTFYSSGLDALALENYLVLKSQADSE